MVDVDHFFNFKIVFYTIFAIVFIYLTQFLYKFMEGLKNLMAYKERTANKNKTN